MYTAIMFALEDAIKAFIKKDIRVKKEKRQDIKLLNIDSDCQESVTVINDLVNRGVLGFSGEGVFVPTQDYYEYVQNFAHVPVEMVNDDMEEL